MRPGGNILVRTGPGGGELVPIDHGLCLPDTFADISFEWRYWCAPPGLSGSHFQTCVLRASRRCMGRRLEAAACTACGAEMPYDGLLHHPSF